jgi:cAMP-dependent protein kinase regulator
MYKPSTYRKEIETLDSLIRLEQPNDVLQFCADYFLSRLAEERTAYISHNTLPSRNSGAMSGTAFTSPFAANSNPFGTDGPKLQTTPPAQLLNVVEEDENDTITSPTTGSFGGTGTFRVPFGGDGSLDGPPSSVRTPPNPDSYPAQYNFGRRTSVSAESLKPVADENDNWSPPSYPKSAEQLGRLQMAISGNFLFSHLDDEQTAQILGALQEKPIPAKDIKVGNKPLQPVSIYDR